MPGSAIVPKVTAPKEIRPRPSQRGANGVGAAAASFEGTAKAVQFQSNSMQSLLCRAVMVVTMMAVMMSGGKGRAGKDEHKENGSENLLHGANVARAFLWKPAGPGSESSEERA